MRKLVQKQYTDLLVKVELDLIREKNNHFIFYLLGAYGQYAYIGCVTQYTLINYRDLCFQVLVA